MKLFHYPHAPYSRKVLLAAFEKNAAFESEICLPFDREVKERLRTVHPLATVPLLVTSTAGVREVFTESSIIVEAFDLASEDGPRLVPADPRAALRARALDRFGDSHLMGPTVYLAWSLRKPTEQQNPEKIGAQRKVVETALGLADTWLANDAFLAGATLSLADLSSVAALSCLLSDRSLADLERWPNVARWYDAITTRPSFQRILAACATVPLPPGF